MATCGSPCDNRLVPTASRAVEGASRPRRCNSWPGRGFGRVGAPPGRHGKAWGGWSPGIVMPTPGALKNKTKTNYISFQSKNHHFVRTVFTVICPSFLSCIAYDVPTPTPPTTSYTARMTPRWVRGCSLVSGQGMAQKITITPAGIDLQQAL